MSSIGSRIEELVSTLNITKTAFAEKIKVTQPYISKLISGNGIPSDRLIEDICEKYDVNEKWLRNGEGEMYIQRTRSEKITDFAADLLNEEEESFKRRLIEALAELDIDEWALLEKISEKATKKRKG